MPKRIFLRLCLLSSLVFAGVPAQAAMTTVPSPRDRITQPGTVKTLPQIAAEEPASAQVALTLEDLPPGFTALPPELAATVASRLDVLKQQLGQGNMKLENFFAFVNPQNFQIVLGFTGKLPTQPEQASFDASLQQIQQPDVQQRMVGQLQNQLKSFGEVKVTEYKALPGLNNLANASTGMTMGLEMQGQPLQMDLAAFRRNGVGAFTAVMYAKGEKPALAVGDVAQKLDGRIVKLSPDTGGSSSGNVK